MSNKFKVEMMFFHGWDDAEWTIDGIPQRFDSEQEAQDEIDEFIADAKEDGLKYDKEDFRVVAV